MAKPTLHEFTALVEHGADSAVADYVERLLNDRAVLLAACVKTVRENGHLADGDVCTLIDLKRAIAKVKAKR